jgi:protein phosphatase
MIHVSWGSATHAGRTRPVNEDALLAAPPIFLVADGMGGHASGGTASSIVVEEFRAPADSSFVTAEWVMAAFRRAHDRIRTAFNGGTTVAGLAAVQQNGNPYWLIFNVGDSRVYHCANGQVVQISVDHSVVQELIDSGELSADKARTHPHRHIITRAVGSPEEIRPDFWLLPAVSGDRLMICSDGVTSEIGPDEIGQLTRSLDGPAQSVAESLLELALRYGGRDNITVVVVDVLAVEAEPSSTDSELIPNLREAIDNDRTLPRFPTITLVGSGDTVGSADLPAGTA